MNVVSVPVNFFGMNLAELTPGTVVVKVIFAMICSGILGMQRTKKRRAAGVRTYMLVCLGASLTIMTSQFIAAEVGQTDISRLGAQVVSGIGFLGAGTILFTGYKQIKGLTTAAGLWASACLGLAIGAGFIYGALLTCLAVFFCMTIMEKVEHDFIMKSKTIHVFILFKSMNELTPFLAFLKEKQYTIDDFDTLSQNAATQSVILSLSYKQEITHEAVIEQLKTCEGIILIEEY